MAITIPTQWEIHSAAHLAVLQELVWNAPSQGRVRAHQRSDRPPSGQRGSQADATRACQPLRTPGTYPEIVTKRNGALRKAVADEGTRSKLFNLGAVLPEAKELSPEYLGPFVKAEGLTWAPFLSDFK